MVLCKWCSASADVEIATRYSGMDQELEILVEG